MNINFLVKYYILLLVIIGISKVSSQENELNKESIIISEAFQLLMKYPDSSEVKIGYIKIFPEDSEQFINTFHTDSFDQLTLQSLEYIKLLTDQINYYPNLVGDKLIKLSIGFKKHDADAIGAIKRSTITYANKNYENFLSIINTLSEKELNELITFLADAENHSAYKAYSEFMKKLDENNESGLYIRFNEAKKKRMNKENH